jgi:hypothetical protein
MQAFANTTILPVVKINYEIPKETHEQKSSNCLTPRFG